MDLTAAVVDAFQRLPTADSRRDALAALLAALTPHEWRRLHALTGARSFHFDIIANLPIELVAAVFSHLDTSTPYRLQRVSKPWGHRLRSLDILKPALSKWYEGTRDLSNADYAECKTEAQHLHAFREGKPQTSFKLGLNDPVAASVLVGETLIWQPRTSPCRAVYLLNVKTWHLQTASAEGRVAIHSFCASDQIVVLATLDVFYVFTIHDLKQKKFKMPSHAFREAMTCRGRTVACAATFAEYIQVYISDYDTQRGKSFRVTRDPSHSFFSIGPSIRYRVALLLHPHNNTITIFAESHASQQPPRRFSFRTLIGSNSYYRFNFDGKCLGGSTMTQTGCSLWGAPDGFVPVNHRGLFAVRVKTAIAEHQRDLLLQFDENLNKFTAINDPESEDRVWVDSSMAWWKDTFYGEEIDETKGVKLNLWGFLGNSHRSCFKTLVITDEESSLPASTCANSTLVNDKYAIFNIGPSFIVFKFEHDVNRPQAAGPIRKVEMLNHTRSDEADVT